MSANTHQSFASDITLLLLTGVLSWGSWWAWRFILCPILYPEEPRELRILSHVISLMALKLLTSTREK